jgi:hypothetical protein
MDRLSLMSSAFGHELKDEVVIYQEDLLLMLTNQKGVGLYRFF